VLTLSVPWVVEDHIFPRETNNDTVVVFAVSRLKKVDNEWYVVREQKSYLFKRGVVIDIAVKSSFESRGDHILMARPIFHFGLELLGELGFRLAEPIVRKHHLE
jgi:hypothetical protein